MDGRLFFAQQLAQGLVVPEGTYRIELNSHEITFMAEQDFDKPSSSFSSGTYRTSMIDWAEFENEQVGYDKYTIEFDSYQEFTLEEFEQWKLENPNAIENMKESQRSAITRLAELSDIINKALAEGETLADSVGLPFMIKVGREYQDVRKLKAVDWNSSSMYC